MSAFSGAEPNTMHTVADAVQDAVSIPLLHIVDPTARAIKDAGLSDVGLRATRYTMGHDFYRGRLDSEHGLSALGPDEPLRTSIHEITTASSWSA
jgi:amino-acid racemase